MREMDPNALATLLYEEPELEAQINKYQPLRSFKPGNVSNYHNSGERGQKGLSAEEAACAYLEASGYRILMRNFSCYVGEIDVIAVKDGVLSFVEVKSRSNLVFGLPRDSVTVAKQKKIRRCAEFYLKVRGLIDRMPPLSFDVIEIIGTKEGIKSLNHLKSCF